MALSKSELLPMLPLVKHLVLPCFASKLAVHVSILLPCCKILKGTNGILLISTSQPGTEDRMSPEWKVGGIHIEVFRKQPKSQQQEM